MTTQRDEAVNGALVIDRAELLTAPWLTSALRAAGHDVRVTELTCEPVGVGLIGANVRVRIVDADGSDAGGLPPSFVAKLPATDVAARASVSPGYRAEVAFYTQVRDTTAVRTPRCWFAASNDDGSEFVLLLEDAHPAVPGDQIAGCSADEARAAVINLAGLHATRWCDPTLQDLRFLGATDEAVAAFLGELVTSATGVFVERFGGALADEDVATLHAAAEVVPAFLLGRPERFGLVHGDYRLDNLLFGADGEVLAVDWQTLSLGLPVRDLSYFLGTSLVVDDRRAHERALVEAYHGALVGLGVEGYPLETCWDDYRFGFVQGPQILTLGAAYGAHTPRAEVLFPTMIARVGTAMRDHGTVELVRAG